MTDLSAPIAEAAAGIDARSLCAAFGDRRVVFAVPFGSALYGTAMPQSDADIRAVILPSEEEILTGRHDFTIDATASASPSGRASGVKLGAGDIDIAGHSLARFLRLLGKFDLNALEMLFAAGAGYAGAPPDPVATALIENRASLIGAGSASAMGQARRILGPLAPRSDAYGDTFRAVLAELAGIDGADRLDAHPETLAALAGIDGVDVIDREDRSGEILEEIAARDIPARLAGGRPGRLYLRVRNRLSALGNPVGELATMMRKPIDRNHRERRSKQSVAGLAPKDIYHAVRVLGEAAELGRTGWLRFPRPDAETLTAIRRDALPSGDLEHLVQDRFSAAEQAEAAGWPFAAHQDATLRKKILVAAHRGVVTPRGGDQGALCP